MMIFGIIIILIVIATGVYCRFRALNKKLRIEQGFNEFLKTAIHFFENSNIVFCIFEIESSLRGIYINNPRFFSTHANIVNTQLNKLELIEEQLGNYDKLYYANFRKKVLLLLSLFPRKKRELVENFLQSAREEKKGKT